MIRMRRLMLSVSMSDRRLGFGVIRMDRGGVKDRDDLGCRSAWGENKFLLEDDLSSQRDCEKDSKNSLWINNSLVKVRKTAQLPEESDARAPSDELPPWEVDGWGSVGFEIEHLEGGNDTDETGS
jgi:hypothetical protein